MCPRGYTLDPTGKFCVDNDECDDDSACEHSCQVCGIINRHSAESVDLYPNFGTTIAGLISTYNEA